MLFGQRKKKLELKDLIDQSEVIIVDVREPWEYEAGHVDGSFNIPLRTLVSRRDEFRKMEKPIILYCRSGNRSQQANLLLRAAGIKSVYNGGSMDDVKTLLKPAA